MARGRYPFAGNVIRFRGSRRRVQRVRLKDHIGGVIVLVIVFIGLVITCIHFGRLLQHRPPHSHLHR
jgi:hypothetical protein